MAGGAICAVRGLVRGAGLAARAALRAENEVQSERIRRLEHLVRALQRVVCGKRSEKLSADARKLAFEALEGASAEVEAAGPPEDPSPESTLCGCGEMVKIGEDRTERLDLVPAPLRVIVTVRPKDACRQCEEGVTQAPAPARLIEGGLPTEGAIAPVLTSKHADHCPLHRQATIYARSGLELDRSTPGLPTGPAGSARRRSILAPYMSA